MTELEIKELQRDLLETQKLMIRTRDMSYMQRSLMGAINTFSSKPEYDHLYTSTTEHIEYGQSKDMSHDLAICIKK